MRKQSLRLKHLSQEHMAAMRLASAARDAAAEHEDNMPGFAIKVCAIFAQEVEPHFREEEQHVIPVLRAAGRDDLADRTLAEHVALRAAVADLAEPTAERIRRFSELLQAHVQFEEDVTWDIIDAQLEAKKTVHA